MNTQELNKPILIAAWPGMGQVAATACYYLISKLEMEVHAEYASSELFDVDHVSVESGRVQPFRYPKNQFFVWRNPDGDHDLLVFMGEAQPPLGRYTFCRKLIDFAQREGVSKVFTFAAMASPVGLTEELRVLGAATDQETLQEFRDNDLALLEGGSISGMNGILLGVAEERKLSGGCLLGEMPQMLVNVPYPKASLAALQAFSQLTGIDVDLTELGVEVDRMDKYLSEAMMQFRHLEQKQGETDYRDEEAFIPDPMENDKLSQEEREMLERMFAEAQRDRSKAYELKRELDRLNVFREYEDRFLDLFKKDDD